MTEDRTLAPIVRSPCREQFYSPARLFGLFRACCPTQWRAQVFLFCFNGVNRLLFSASRQSSIGPIAQHHTKS